ncbi:ribosome-recycling factor, chloroplastic isoform X1 [Capsicum annuum]|uniref:ribosome-recycling factor, chloroplastic isoform X1 n=1 Tax=Capsicum annuum TaxID=4072 RepID=UPI0007BF05DF|nr:ribosome-recycling factor, chloroplastic isoform X1 [Capsicum annuum]
MTIALSPATPAYQRQLTHKPFFCFLGKFRTSGNVVSLSASANYVSLRVGASRLQPPVKHAWGKRRGIVRCATIEEIEAEKSLIEKDVKERMEKTVETVRSNFNSIRTGRASPAMLDKIEVDYYGTPVSLKSIAQISTPDASSILVQPYDKSSLKSIEKAIVNSDVGMTPNNDGEVIRLAVPQLTSDRRKELSKIVSKQAEEGKVAIRNIRRDALKAYEKLEKEKKLSEDNVKDLSSDLQKVTDEYMKKIDTVFKQKEKERLSSSEKRLLLEMEYYNAAAAAFPCPMLILSI